MSPFDLNVLVGPAMVIFLCTLAISFRITANLALAICLAFAKAGLFTLYFGLVFDGTYTFLDDWNYLKGGQQLLRNDVGLTNLAENWQFVRMVGEGDHFLYYVYNAYAFRIFGEGYFAPVALNVLLTLAISYIGARLAAVEFQLGVRASRAFFVFLLLHPDILAWSNVMNGKDILVLLLHVLLACSVSIFLRGHIVKALLFATPVVFILFFLRFYVPLLFTVALITSVILGQRGGWMKVGYLLASALILAGTLIWIGSITIGYVMELVAADFVNPAFGFLRMALTPIPFKTDDDYAFLNLPSLIHWLLTPFVVLGVVCIWKLYSPFSRFFLIYVLVFVGVYAVFGQLQGPRHRVQLDYAWAVFQFMGVRQFLRVVLSSHRHRYELRRDWVLSQ